VGLKVASLKSNALSDAGDTVQDLLDWTGNSLPRRPVREPDGVEGVGDGEGFSVVDATLVGSGLEEAFLVDEAVSVEPAGPSVALGAAVVTGAVPPLTTFREGCATTGTFVAGLAGHAFLRTGRAVATTARQRKKKTIALEVNMAIEGRLREGQVLKREWS
jgi:hypothetical protein